MEPDDDLGLHLVRGRENVDEVDLLAERLGGRVGLGAVLDDLNRTARPARVPGSAARWGFRWDHEDDHSRRWWPQGITTSADAHPDESFAGRRVVLTSAYSKTVDGLDKGARISVADVTERDRVRYRHVLLVDPHVGPDGRLGVRPVHVHAGGIVWHGGHLHVAGTRRGFATFRLDDLLRVPGNGDTDRLALEPSGVHAFGYRYVLPLRFWYDAVTRPDRAKLRYSFMSLDRSSTPKALVAGEYGRGSMTTRLVRYGLDPETGLPTADAGGAARPVLLDERGVGHAQGAVVVDGRWYVTASAGRFRRGSVWSGSPGALRRHRFTLPVGPEDVTYWPSTDELWSLSEYPGRRIVFAMPRRRFD